jgi:hypothetical protein
VVAAGHGAALGSGWIVGSSDRGGRFDLTCKSGSREGGQVRNGPMGQLDDSESDMAAACSACAVCEVVHVRAWVAGVLTVLLDGCEYMLGAAVS